MLRVGFGVWAAIAACGDGTTDDSSETVVQPIELNTSPSEYGVNVGMRTVSYDGVTLEVWYPAAEDGEGVTSALMNFVEYIPASFIAAVPGFALPDVNSSVLRNAPVRNAGEPLPVVLFSHGFGGMRIQSFSLTAHLASRGYVVVAPDHPGRMLTDVLPCIFSPPLEGCDLSGFASDPGPPGLATALEWVDDANRQGPFAGLLDVDALGIAGHSAGAGSVTSFAAQEPRVRGVVPMAGGGPPDTDVPLLRIDGSCDGFVPAAAPESIDGRADATFVTVHGAGHLAFSDLCELDIAGFAAEFLDPRDDLNGALYPQLKGLGTDGCAAAMPQVESEDCGGEFLPLDVSHEIIRHHTTVFFDDVLKGFNDWPEQTFDAASVYQP